MKIDPSAPSFFKIIISPSIDLHKLRIPPAFVKEFRSSLLGHVCIRAPGGEEHRVILRNEEKHIWFSNGWEEFADYYSLDYGYFLIFQYKENSEFNVFIFDKSCMEIDYRNLDTKNSDQDEDHHDDEVEEDDNDGYYKYDDNEDTDDSTDEYENDEEEDEDDDEDEEEDDDKDENYKKRGKRKKCIKGERTQRRISRALEEAKALKCRNPSFVVSLAHWYLKPGNVSRLWVPRGYARNHLEVTNKVTLQVKDDPNTKTWTVYVKRGSDSTHFSHGWSSFTGDNLLQVGDVCVFELIHRRNQIYCVHIFRYS